MRRYGHGLPKGDREVVQVLGPVGDMGPVGRDVVGSQPNADPRFTLDDHHVPVILGIYGPVEHPGPAAALGREVCGVEDHDLATDVHRVILSGNHDSLDGNSSALLKWVFI
jgi:hypothetical protein